MTKNDRWVEAKYHGKQCNYYSPLQRLYYRKTTRGKVEIDPDTQKISGYSQKYLGYGWLCSECGLIVIDPVQCPKCESRDIAMGKSDNYGERHDKEWYHCNKCKKKWKVKIKKMKTVRVEIR